MIAPQPVVLRAATTADAERIAALFTDEGYPAAASTIAGRIERFTAGSGTVLVAEDAGEILGFVAVHLMPRFEHDDTIARVLALVVDAGARGRGVGHDLMSAADAIARDAGAAFIEVTAAHHRAEARHLYESLGYDATVTAYLRKRL
jgi:ribosomal protein S18 acetylase RimI-like enzyme